MQANTQLLKKISTKWMDRAGIRTLSDLPKNIDFVAQIPDYPVSLIPFREKEEYINASEQKKLDIAALAWIVYNMRTIAAEENVANPAFAYIMQDKIPGLDEFHLKQSIQQSLIDEHFHTLMHREAIERTCKNRGIDTLPKFPHSITYRRLLEAQEKYTKDWQQQYLVFIFAVVSEISINALLDLLENAEGIQPFHNLITRIHNQDEHAHSAILVEVTKQAYLAMDNEEKEFFCCMLPVALKAFVEQDYSAWQLILEQVNIGDPVKIIASCREMNTTKPESQNMVRDYSGLKKLCKALQIEDRVDFSFVDSGRPLPWEKEFEY